MAQAEGKHFVFTGQFSGGGDTHDALGFMFHGRNPRYVTGPAVQWFDGNPLYHEVEAPAPLPDPLDHDGDGKKGGSKPRKARAK